MLKASTHIGMLWSEETSIQGINVGVQGHYGYRSIKEMVPQEGELLCPLMWRIMQLLNCMRMQGTRFATRTLAN